MDPKKNLLLTLLVLTITACSSLSLHADEVDNLNQLLDQKPRMQQLKDQLLKLPKAPWEYTITHFFGNTLAPYTSELAAVMADYETQPPSIQFNPTYRERTESNCLSYLIAINKMLRDSVEYASENDENKKYYKVMVKAQKYLRGQVILSPEGYLDSKYTDPLQ